MSDYDDAVTQFQSEQQATGTKPGLDSGYDGAAQQLAEQNRAQAATALSSSIDVNADQAATNAKIAKLYNVPPAVVQQFPDDFRQRAATQIANETLAKAPVLQQTLNQNPALAPVIHDDVQNAAAIEKTAGATVADDLLNALPDYAKGLARTVNESLKDIAVMPTAGVATLIDKAFGTNLADKIFPAATWLDEQDKSLALRPDADFTGKAADRVGSLLGMVMGADVTSGTKLATEGVSQATTLWPTISRVLQHGTAAGAIPSLTAAVEQGQRVYEQTGDGMAAFNAAKAGYVTNTGMMMVPMSAPGKWYARAAGGFVAGVGSGELARRYTNANMPANTPPDFEEAMLQGLMGVGFGVMGGRDTSGLNDAIRQTYTDAAKAEQAAADHQRLDVLGQLSEASKWRTRDPEGFNKFVSDVTEDGRLKDVYVGAKTFQQAMEKTGFTQADIESVMPDVAKQMGEGLTFTHDIKITTADYATHLAGNDLGNEILPDLRTLANKDTGELGMTYKEQEDFYKDTESRLTDQAKKISEQRGENQAWQDSADNVHDRILQGIQENTALPSHVAKVNARVMSTAMETGARRLGITPEEFYEQHGVDFTGAGKGEFDQGDQDEQIHRLQDKYDYSREEAVQDYYNGKRIDEKGNETAQPYGQGDVLYNRAKVATRESGYTGVPHIMRNLKVGKPRAHGIINQMEADGYIEPKSHVEGTFTPTDKLHNDNTLFQSTDLTVPGQKGLATIEPQPAFYSPLARAIGMSSQKKGTPEQWQGIINNLTQKGVKKAQIEATGVNDWLEMLKTQADYYNEIDPQGRIAGTGMEPYEPIAGNKLVLVQPSKMVTKEDVLDHINHNDVIVSPRIQGGPRYPGDNQAELDRKASNIARQRDYERTDEIDSDYPRSSEYENTHDREFYFHFGSWETDEPDEDYLYKLAQENLGSMDEEHIRELVMEKMQPDEDDPEEMAKVEALIEYIDRESYPYPSDSDVPEGTKRALEKILDELQDQERDWHYESGDAPASRTITVQANGSEYTYNHREHCGDHELYSQENNEVDIGQRRPDDTAIRAAIYGHIAEHYGERTYDQDEYNELREQDEAELEERHEAEEEQAAAEAQQQVLGLPGLDEGGQLTLPNLEGEVGEPPAPPPPPKPVRQFISPKWGDSSYTIKGGKDYQERLLINQTHKGETFSYTIHYDPNNIVAYHRSETRDIPVETFKDSHPELYKRLTGAGETHAKVYLVQENQSDWGQQGGEHPMETVHYKPEDLHVDEEHEAEGEQRLKESKVVQIHDARGAEHDYGNTWFIVDTTHASTPDGPVILGARGGYGNEEQAEAYRQRLAGAHVWEIKAPDQVFHLINKTDYPTREDAIRHIVEDKTSERESKMTNFDVTRKRDELQKQADAILRKINALPTPLSSDDLRLSNNMHSEVAALREKIDALPTGSGHVRSGNFVPLGPIVGNTDMWVSLLLKDQIRDAAERGHHLITWLNADQQVARYGNALKEVVDTVEWQKKDDGLYHVIAYKDSVPKVNQAYDEANLKATFGDEMAKSMVEGGDSGKLEGDQIRISTNAMATFYGNEHGNDLKGKPAIVAKVANEILKKIYGSDQKVKMYDLAGGATTDKDWLNKNISQQPGFEMTPQIVAKALEGVPLMQKNRGFYSPEHRLMGILRDADLSTFIHETGHYLFDVYSKIAVGENAPQEIKDDVQKLLNFVGVPDLDTWNKMGVEAQRPAHEQIARAMESYFMEGKAPSADLQPVFARIKAWMEYVYTTAKNLGVELTPEVRQVFDRMFASRDQIGEAEAQRGYTGLFTAPPEGVSPEVWAEYQKQGQEATQTAIDTMQSKSVRDMKWMSGARDEALRKLQKEAAGERRKITDEVGKQVDAMPEYRANRWLRTGEMTTDSGEEIKLSPEARKGAKLSTEDLRTMYPDTALGRPDLDRIRALTSPGGMHPDLVAEMFGMGSGDALVRSLTELQPRVEVIKGMTDQRMLEEHGEVATEAARADAANAAVHNEARARFMATGLKILTKSPIPARQIEKAAQQAAQAAIDDKTVGEVNPKLYMAAETKANSQAIKLAPKEPLKAVQAQRAALLNNQLAKAALEQKAAEAKAIQYLKRFNKKQVMAKMDVDVRDQITDLLGRFDLRQNPDIGPTKQQQMLATWIESQKALGYTPNTTPEMLDPAFKKHYKDMKVSEFKGMVDTVKMIEQLGKERKMITIDGQRMAVRQAVDEMKAKMLERGENFTDAQLAEKKRLGVDPLWRVGLDRVGSMMRAIDTEFKPQSFKANKYDVHQILGPFHRYLFEPVFNANYHFLDLRREVSNHFRDAAKDLGDDWQKTLNEVVENHNLMDNSLDEPSRRRLTRGDLIGVALHVGNESNFDKLTGGMGWEPEDVWKTLHDNMREKDWQAARIVGETAGQHWPEMDAMNRRLGNTSPEKIEPRPFMTKFGEMPGWYAPVKYDPIRSKLGRKKADATNVNPAEGLFARDYYRADTTTNGSMNARASGYHDFVDLNYHATEGAIHDSLRDLAYREALVNAHKLYVDREFRKQFKRSYGPEEYKALGEWLGRLVNSEVGDEKSSQLAAILGATRRAIVANGIAFRISTMEKHGGSAGLKSVGYLAGGGEKYFLARAKAIATNHNKEVVEALAKFPELRARANQQDRDMAQTISSLMEPESAHAKAERFGHAGVAYMDFLTAVPTAHAAYDWAITDGIPKRLGGTGKPMSHEDAVKFANGVVREAHGSNIESARSNLVNNKSELVKMLTVLHGFMNNSFGQHMDTIDKALHANGFGKPELLARYMMTQIVPAMLAAYITFGPKKDDQPWWKWAAGAIGGEFAAELPMIREAYKTVAEGYDKAGLPPWMDALTNLFKAGKSVAKGAAGEPVKQPIKDLGNGAGLFLPGLGQAGSTAQFLYDEHTGKQQAHTVGDWVRGVTTGKAAAPKP